MSDERIPEKLQGHFVDFVTMCSESHNSEACDAAALLVRYREATAKCTCGHWNCEHGIGRCSGWVQIPGLVSGRANLCDCTKFVPAAAGGGADATEGGE